MAQVRYLGIAMGEPFDASSLRTDPRLGIFVPASEPLPVGTKVDLDGATLLVLRVEEGVTPGCWLRADAVPRPNTDDVTTARNLEMVAEPESSDSDVDAEPAKPTGEEKPEGGGERKRRKRGKTLVGR